MEDFTSLPADLPIPIDDGAADHLVGLAMPDVELFDTSGVRVNLSALGNGRSILFVYPMTGRPGVEQPDGWDSIPGARGCTAEACGFRDLFQELQAAGGQRVFGLSRQDSDYQSEAAERLHLPFTLLSDAHGLLGEALSLPAFDVAGMTLYRRLTLVIRDGMIEKVFYPVFPPDRHAEDLLDWLRTQP